MTFIKLTAPDGQGIWIAARWVTKVHAPIKGHHSPKANAIVAMGQTDQAVQEEVKEVLKLLEGVPDQ